MAAGASGSQRQKGLFRGIAWVAVVCVTIGLSMLSISGAWILSNGNYFYTLGIAGMEMTAFISLTMIVYANTTLRRIAGWCIFVVAIGVCIFNAERAMKHAFGLKESPAVLLAQAEELETRATEQAGVSEAARARQVTEQETLRTEIAALKVERQLMVSGNVRRAQERLCALDLYPCDMIDGQRGEFTNQALQSRAGAIATEIGIKEQLLEAPGDLTVSSKAGELKAEAAEKKERAAKIANSIWWILATLLGKELVRSFAVWAFLMDDTASQTRNQSRKDEAESETEAVEAENELEKAKAKEAEVTSEDTSEQQEDTPDEQEDEPENEDLILDEELDQTDEEVDAATAARRKNLQKGRDSQAHAREAAKNITKVLVTDDVIEAEELEIEEPLGEAA